MPETKLVALESGLYALDQGGVRAFLLVGSERALLIDCGVFPADLRALIASVTDRPLTVALTHTDGDHTANVEQFDRVLVHPADEPILLRDHPAMAGKTAPLSEGDVLDLGGETQQVIHIPGHTPGSVGFLNRAKGYFIPGDTAGHEAVYLFGDARDLPLYRQSLARLEKLEGFDRLYPSHGACPVGREAISTLLDLAGRIEAGTIAGAEPEAERLRGAGVKLYKLGSCGILHP